MYNGLQNRRYITRGLIYVIHGDYIIYKAFYRFVYYVCQALYKLYNGSHNRRIDITLYIKPDTRYISTFSHLRIKPYDLHIIHNGCIKNAYWLTESTLHYI